ncbi:MAG: hypothetical protein ACLUFP_03480 [Streptococcus salivarius]
MQNIDNVNVYFDADGKQVKGDTRQVNGATYHFEKDSGHLPVMLLHLIRMEIGTT